MPPSGWQPSLFISIRWFCLFISVNLICFPLWVSPLYFLDTQSVKSKCRPQSWLNAIVGYVNYPKKRSGKAFEHFGGPCNVNEKHELRTALQHEADEPKVIKWNRCHQWWLTTKEAETKAPARSLEITECKPHGQYSHRYITTIQEKSSFSLRLFVSCASFLFLAFICIRKFIVCFPEPLIYRFRQLLYFLVYFDIFFRPTPLGFRQVVQHVRLHVAEMSELTNWRKMAVCLLSDRKSKLVVDRRPGESHLALDGKKLATGFECSRLLLPTWCGLCDFDAFRAAEEGAWCGLQNRTSAEASGFNLLRVHFWTPLQRKRF